MPITHAKVSAVADSAATGLVQPSEWNAAHVIGALGTPSADGIAFPATQVPNAGANVLDDYEEGTWTPGVTFATPGNLAVAYSTQNGRYTRIGRLVLAYFSCITSSFTHSTASGAFTITGLPFTINATLAPVGCLYVGGYTWTPVDDLVMRGAGGGTVMTLYKSSSGAAPAQASVTHFPTGAAVNMQGSIMYDV